MKTLMLMGLIVCAGCASQKAVYSPEPVHPVQVETHPVDVSVSTDPEEERYQASLHRIAAEMQRESNALMECVSQGRGAVCETMRKSFCEITSEIDAHSFEHPKPYCGQEH